MPQVAGGPASLNKRLEEVYSGCMRGQDGSEANKKVCAAVAWKQAKKEGWVKKGETWEKRKSRRIG